MASPPPDFTDSSLSGRMMKSREGQRLTLYRYIYMWMRASFALQGRPELVSLGAVPIRFNSICSIPMGSSDVLSTVSRLWIDVERVDQVDYEDLATTVRVAFELSEVMGLDKKLTRDCFVEFWAIKEAYLKDRDLGLSHPLREIVFSHFDGKHLCTPSPSANDGRKWCFWSSKP